MHTVVLADGALEAKSARDSRHRLFLKGAWSEQMANRMSNRAARASKSDNNCSYQGNLGVKKVDFLMQNAWSCFTKTCFPLQREAFFEKMWLGRVCWTRKAQMEAQIAYKIHTQEGPLPLARQLLVNFENHRGGHSEILLSKVAHFRSLWEAKRSRFQIFA